LRKLQKNIAKALPSPTSTRLPKEKQYKACFDLTKGKNKNLVIKARQEA